VRILYFADIRFPLERANGIQTMETCYALAERGHRVDLVVRPDTQAPARDPFEYYGLSPLERLAIERAPVTGPGVPAIGRRIGYLAFAAGRAMGASRADILMTRDLTVASLLLRLPSRPPLVYESHGYAPDVAAALPDLVSTARPPSRAKLARLAKREAQVWKRADGYVTITAGLAEELTTRFGPRLRLAVVPDGTRIPGRRYADFADPRDADHADPRDADHADPRDADHADPRDADHADPRDADHADPRDADHADPRDADYADSRNADHANSRDANHADPRDADRADLAGHSPSSPTYERPNVRASDLPSVRASDLPNVRASDADHISQVVVGYAGHLYPWKGVDLLLEALARVPEVRGLIVGGHEKESDLGRLRALAARLGIQDRVTFTGQLPPAAVPEQLTRADILVLPNPASAISTRATSPLKLFEYMAARRTIVAADLPSLREVLTDDVNAVFVAPGDVEALAAGIRRLVNDSAMRERLAAAAGQAVAEYSWSRRAERLEALFTGLLAGGRSRP
jgi:glycosyltransferase involved in cell wall biosynthesis